MMQLTSALRQAICAEGERAYPNECCGILLGQQREEGVRCADEIIPIHNAREAAEQYHRFLIEPDDVLRAELRAQEQGKDVLGFYHSHPDHPAQPSEYDREHALPFYSYVIVSVEKGKATDLTSWALSTDRTRFADEGCLAV
ncbi:MAG: M67 family metallopeptidase [Burkholderiaceae bacterium]|jgi:proteasome lid subunit RPN8/RPN11|nr:M67 family metallopeptidase [Burkholderiaceae bacterium]